jgi:RNA polymerase sigma-70 factor (ECF subfamily)
LAFIKNISPTGLSDADLLQLYKKQENIGLLADLYQRYLDMVYAVCVKYLKDTETSKDAVMDIFESLPAKVLKHEITSFRSWLYVLVKNHCLMQLRSASNGLFTELEEVHMQNGTILHPDNNEQEKDWQIEKLKDCIEKLGKAQKESVTLFYLDNKCYKDISAITGLDWNKVRSLIQNGKRNLKICMEQHTRQKI